MNGAIRSPTRLCGRFPAHPHPRALGTEGGVHVCSLFIWGWGGGGGNYWAPLTRKRHTMPHSAQPQHTKYWAPRTRKRHQQEHRPQRPTERSDPTQHSKGRTGECPGPRKGATTRRNVTQGGGGGGLLTFRDPGSNPGGGERHPPPPHPVPSERPVNKYLVFGPFSFGTHMSLVPSVRVHDLGYTIGEMIVMCVAMMRVNIVQHNARDW